MRHTKNHHRAEERRRRITSLLRHAVVVVVTVLITASPVMAERPEIVFVPTDNVTQHGEDFPRLFEDPQSWSAAAKHVAIFEFPVNYLLRSPRMTVKWQLEWLRSRGIKLSVGIPALPVDKRICGDGIEGMTWPGEAALMGQQLKELGAEVDFFGFDLPLTNGHFADNRTACHLSIQETANRLAASVRELRRFYPQAQLVDAEVPTGIPLSQWRSALSEWLPAFRQASGEDLYALFMDVWWKAEWQDAVRETVRILAGQSIRSGIFLDATGGNGVAAKDWIADARANACALRGTKIALDYVSIANWLDMQVKNLPETDSDTLTGFLDWFAANGTCSR
jgi:hypothetical protein